MFIDDFYKNRLEHDSRVLNKTVIIIGQHNNIVI